MNLLNMDGIVTPMKRLVSGADPKEWVTLGGDQYLMKWGKQRNELAPFSEFVASRFLRYMNIPVQTVELVIYKDSVCAMCSDIGTIKQFADISESSLDTDKNDKVYILEDILHEIASMRKFTPEQRTEIATIFKRVFLCDAVLANRDRHAGNWGYRDTGDFCPIYDNGASLFPGLLHNEEPNLKRLYHILTIEEPRSQVQIRAQSGKLKKFNYHRLLEDTELINEELSWIKKANVPEAINWAVAPLPPEMARHYHYVMYLRYYCIIEREDFNDVFKRLTSLSYEAPSSVHDILEWASDMPLNGVGESV